MAKPRKTGRGDRRAIAACVRARRILSQKYTGEEAAAKLGLTRMAIWKWDAIPPARVPGVSELTGIPKHELRPDLPELFPKP